jgi:hypothetical protein
MSERSDRAGMTARAATRLEFAIIGLGLFALILIFQPFSLPLFSIGCVLVVLAGLVNTLLPLCETGVGYRTVINAALIVALIFFLVMIVAVASAHLYALYLITQSPAAAAAPQGTPFYEKPFMWVVAALTVVLAAAVYGLNRR